MASRPKAEPPVREVVVADRCAWAKYDANEIDCTAPTEDTIARGRGRPADARRDRILTVLETE